MNSMKIKSILAALILVALASSASATVLTFDNLDNLDNATTYGNGSPLLDSMSYDGKNLTYQESGFQLTLNAPNSETGAADIGSGTFDLQTYNWQGGMENGDGAYVTLTRLGGGLFNLISFGYYTDVSTLFADGSQVGTLEGWGTWDTALNGISELRLSSGYFNQLDNIRVENVNAALPLPGTLSLLLGGLAACALVRRRQR
jgi:hypothetical protein